MPLLDARSTAGDDASTSGLAPPAADVSKPNAEPPEPAALLPFQQMMLEGVANGSATTDETILALIRSTLMSRQV